MRSRSLLLSCIGVSIALASCTDFAGPPASAPPSGGVPPVQAGRVRSQVNILVESPSAPQLETYSFEFWVVQGAKKTVSLSYRLGNGTKKTDRFLRLDIPSETQLYLPDGSPVAKGDSVLITATVNRQQLLVTFGPNGLVFGGSKPTRLRLYWANANLDLNGDGVVNEQDTEIIRTQLVIAYQSQAGEPWSIPSDQEKSLDNGYIEISVPHFSNFAISW